MTAAKETNFNMLSRFFWLNIALIRFFLSTNFEADEDRWSVLANVSSCKGFFLQLKLELFIFSVSLVAITIPSKKSGTE